MKIKDTVHFQWYKTLFNFSIIFLLIISSIYITGANITDIFSNIDQMYEFLYNFLKPDFAYIPSLINPMLATIRMSIAGTFLGVFIAIPFAFLATTVFTRNNVITSIVRLFLDIVRTIPNLLLAALVVAIAGIGELSGVITISIFTFGMVSQLIYESIESIDYAPIEAALSVGANRIQIAFWSIAPQIISHITSYIFYSFEVNIRASAVLGYVGAGGIGIILNSSLALFQYSRVSVIILFILFVVIIVDVISERIKEKIDISSNKKNKNIIFISIIFLLVIYSFLKLDYSGLKFFSPSIAMDVFRGLLKPDLSFIYDGSGEDLISLLLSTLGIAFLGSSIAVVLSIPITILSSSNLWKDLKIIPMIGKFICNVLRAFPEIVYAIIFVKIVGPGPFAGVLAIGVHQIGMLGKLYTEQMEEMDETSVEAMTAVGANFWQTMFYSRIPILMPIYSSLALNHFEIALRSAATLGIVGAGGIGASLVFAIQARNWDKVSIILIGVVITVFVIDTFAGYIRKRLR